MDDKKFIQNIKRAIFLLKTLVGVIILLFGVVVFTTLPIFSKYLKPSKEPVVLKVEEPKEEIVDGVHVATGLIAGEGLEVVIQNCTACHSAKLITQNSMTESGWKSTIRWMQQTQNLWQLGDNEKVILAYLSKNYAPK